MLFDNDIGMRSIIHDSCVYACLSNRTVVHKMDILIALKKFKHGYKDFSTPPIVLKVYESVFEENRLQVFKKISNSPSHLHATI